jgi:hypothetical protein
MIKLGEIVVDSISGFTGVATAKTEWLYGCVRICVTPKELKDGKPVDEQWFDEQRLTTDSSATVGGPRNDPVRQSGH